MEWQVSGADKATGADRVLIVEAEDEAQATRRAARAGLMVESARPNVVPPPSKSISGLWLTVLIAGPMVAIALGVYLMQPSPPLAKAAPIAPNVPAVVARAPDPIPATKPTSNPIAVNPLDSATVNHSRELEQQLAKLQTENARLKAAATAPAPVVVAAPQPGSLGGAAWLQRNGGDSIILRGLRVYVTRTDFDAAPILTYLRKLIPQYEQIVDGEKKTVADLEKSAKEDGDDSGYQDPFLTDAKSDLKRDEEALKVFRDIVKRNPKSLSPIEVYDAVERTADILGHFDFPIFNIALGDRQTGIDGKYSFAKVPPGDYYIYASFNAGKTFADWLFPLHVASGETQSVDLSNSNAIRIYNSPY